MSAQNSVSSITNPEKITVLELAVQDILKRYGEGAISRIGELKNFKTSVIPTGSISLDLALGVGGIPRGRVTEIFGPEASGKTTLCLQIIAEAQHMGCVAVYIDMEKAVDLPYAIRLGVDIDRLMVSRPDTGEQALEIAETLIRSGVVDIIAIDSVAALVPRSEIEGDMGDATMDQMDKLMDQAMRKLAGPISVSNTCLIFTNQLRQKLGVMFGNPETTTGGLPLRYWASVRLDIRRIQSINSNSEIIGSRHRVRVVKNRVAAPFRSAEFDMFFNEGISKYGDLLDLATKLEYISKKGKHYEYNQIFLGKSRNDSIEFLRLNKVIANEIEKKIRTDLF